MKKSIIFLFSLLIFVSCKKDNNDTPAPVVDPIIGEWTPEKVVWGLKEIPLDDCVKQLKVIITEKHLTYYHYQKDKNTGECSVSIQEYDYTKTKKNNGQELLKNTSNRSGSYIYALEENQTRLRLQSEEDERDFVIFKKK